MQTKLALLCKRLRYICYLDHRLNWPECIAIYSSSRAVGLYGILNGCSGFVNDPIAQSNGQIPGRPEIQSYKCRSMNVSEQTTTSSGGKYGGYRSISVTWVLAIMSFGLLAGNAMAHACRLCDTNDSLQIIALLERSS